MPVGDRTQKLGASVLSGLTSKYLVKKSVGKPAKQFRHPPHLPGNDTVTGPALYGFEGLEGKILRAHQKGHGVFVFSGQGRVNVAGAQGHDFHASGSHFAAQTFTVADEGGFARAVGAMSGQATDACNAGHAYQFSMPSCCHCRDERVKCSRYADGVGGQYVGHDANIFPNSGIDTEADTGVGNHDLWEAL